MAQYARPTLDVEKGDWAESGYVDTGTPPVLFSSVDEVVPDDGDSILMNASGDQEVCVLQLGEIEEPALGDVTLRVRYRKQASQPNTYMNVALLVGATLVTERSVLVDGESYVTAEFVLTEAERAIIDDWANLRVQLGSGGAAPESGGGVPFGALVFESELLEVEDEVLISGDA